MSQLILLIFKTRRRVSIKCWFSVFAITFKFYTISSLECVNIFFYSCEVEPVKPNIYTPHTAPWNTFWNLEKLPKISVYFDNLNTNGNFLILNWSTSNEMKIPLTFSNRMMCFSVHMRFVDVTKFKQLQKCRYSVFVKF